jgi:hypothetical protein
MSQAEDVCRQLQVRGRRELPSIAKRFNAHRSKKRQAYTFPDGSEIHLVDQNIIEAVTTVTEKFWIGALK